MTEKLQKHLQGETRAAVESDLYPGEIGFNNYETELELIIQDKVTEGNYYHFPSLESDAMFTGGLGLNKTLPDFILKCTDPDVEIDQTLGSISWESSDASTSASGFVGQINLVATENFESPEYVGQGCGTAMTFNVNPLYSPAGSLVEVLRLETVTSGDYFTGAYTSNIKYSGEIFTIEANNEIFDNKSSLFLFGGNAISNSGGYMALHGNEVSDPDTAGSVTIGATTWVGIYTGSVSRFQINGDGSTDVYGNQIGYDGSAGGLSFNSEHLATLTHGLTIGGNLIIPDAGYIGSVSDTDAIQIEADGDVVLSQNLSIAGSFAVQGGGVLEAGDGYADASTARLSPDSIAGRHIITVTPSDDSHDYFALSDKVDGQMVVIENVGDYPAYVDQDETRGIYLDSGNCFSGFWDVTTDKWYGVVGYMCIPD